MGRAVKTAYIAGCLIADQPFERNVDCKKLINEKFIHSELLFVQYLRKVNPEAYAYMIKIDRMI